MNTYIIIAIVVVSLLFMLVIIYFARKKIKKNQLLKTAIPPEVLEEFNYCEQRLKETKGTMTPQEIAWEYYKKVHGSVGIETNTIQEDKQERRNPWLKFQRK